MQSWPNSSQNGADGQHSWQQNFGFTDQNGQFDPGQAWPQSMVDPASSYSHINPPDGATSNYFESPHHRNAYLGGDMHDAPSTQPGFHGSHASLGLASQFPQQGQDEIDPAFGNIHHDLYGQPDKLGLGDDIGHLSSMQKHSHAQPAQTYTPQDFSFSGQNDGLYDASVSQYSSPQPLAQGSRQQTHTTIQSFDDLSTGFSHAHGFHQPAHQHAQRQQSSLQHQAQPYPQGQQDFVSPGVEPMSQFHSSTPSHLDYQQPQSHAANQSVFPPPRPASHSQLSPGPHGHQSPQIAQQSVKTSPPHPSLQPQHSSTQSRISPTPPQQQPPQEASVLPASTTETAPKKRKRPTKSASVEAPAAESPAPPIDLIADGQIRKADDIDSLAAPVPSAEEVQLLVQSSKRSKAAQVKQPPIRGLPHLLYDGTARLPAPKSYDKLAPLVALPSRGGKSIIPELGYHLPCEMQGKFTGQYRPSADNTGLDERRIEAKALLDEFDRSMSSLGKRRPKYTEYPHAFKEQLKSDEASKNKAEKKAKKEQEDERNKPIRAATRPADPVEAAAWDIIGFVYVDSQTAKTNALIASRVQQAGDLLIKLRSEMNRSKLSHDQAVKDKLPDAEISSMKVAYEQKKEALYKALDATIEHSDDAVLDNLGGHQKLILSLINALISCIKATDFSSKLPKIVLELFTHFRMTTKIADTTNFDSVLKRFGDKADKEVKDLVREISANVRKARTSESETATGYTGTSAASRAKSAARSSSESTSGKRGRDDDSDSRAVKKIALESGTGSLSKKLAQPKITSQTVSKSAPAKSTLSSLLPGKAKPPAKPASKPEAASGDSLSSSTDNKSKTENKKSSAKGESTRAAVTTKTDIKPPAPKMGAAPTSSALSGIASLLDSINAPKAEAALSALKEAKGPDTPETPEQTAKRLRKEARRKLRVSWKPEGELVQIKVFHKHAEEDEGRDNNMIRDAADDRSEGMVLKQRADAAVEDEDDDLPYVPWLEPAATDFSNLSQDTRNQNYITRGGTVSFSTEEQQRIADREQRELMSIYTDPDDIPPTPKSPPAEMAVDNTNASITGLPGDDPKFAEIQLRWREERQIGFSDALYAALGRLEAKHNPSSRLDSILGRLTGPAATRSSSQRSFAPTPDPGVPTHNSFPLAAGQAATEQVLGWLRSEKVTTWYDPTPSLGDLSRVYNYSDPTMKMVGSAVEMAAKQLAGKPHPATSPPDWLSKDEEQVREWKLGASKEATARLKKADEERARAEAESNALRAAAAGHQTQGNPQDWGAYYTHQQAYAPYMALLQQMTGGQQPATAPGAAQPQPPPSIPDNQLQSILAAINHAPQQPTHSQTTNQTSYLNPNDPSYQQMMMLAQMSQSQAQASHAQPEERDREPDWGREDDNGKGELNREGKDGRKKKTTLPPHKPANKALIGTKSCTFWQQGKCARGDKCTFRHD